MKKKEESVINKLIGKIFFKSHTAFIMAFLANRDEMNDFMSYGFFKIRRKLGEIDNRCYFVKI